MDKPKKEVAPREVEASHEGDGHAANSEGQVGNDSDQAAPLRAKLFRSRGWKPIPIKACKKGPYGKNWQKREFEDAEFDEYGNVGVQLGEVSDGLVDIDLDWPMACEVAEITMSFAPSFGRPGNPKSHRLFRCKESSVKTVKYSIKGRNKAEGAMVLELRGDGCQTVFPGSIHPSGERIRWTEDMPSLEDTPELDYVDIKRLCDATFVLTMALVYYAGEGKRDELCMALAGVLLRMQFEAETVDEWVVAIAEMAGDEEADKRRKAEATKVKLDESVETTGLPRFLELLETNESGIHEKIKMVCGFRASKAQNKRAIKLSGDEVDISSGKLDSALEQIQNVLLDKDVPIFQRGGQLVMPIRLDADLDTDDDVRRQAGSLLLHPLSGAGLLSVFVRYATFYKINSQGLPMPADPDVKFASVFANGRERWRLRSLDAITGVPVFRPDGSILSEPGYDPATRLWFDPGDFEFPAVLEQPTKADALTALEVLQRPFRDFPIPNPECRTALLAGLITPVILPTVPAVPAIGVSASTPGFGKTKIQSCIGIFSIGADPASMSQADRDEENTKRLDAALLAGDPVIAIDNVIRPVGGDVLCSIVTNSMHKVRILGRSELSKVSSRVLVIANGNNLAFYGDMCRRVLMVLIEDEQVENPEKRDFDFDPVEETKAKRGEMVAASLTILRAWHVAGRPKTDGHKPLGSFEGWEPIRLALLWLGLPDPVKTQRLVAEDDPQREADQELLSLLWESHGKSQFRASDLRSFAHVDGKPTPLGEALLNGAAWSSKRAGNRLRLIADRWIDGVKLKKVRDERSRGKVYLIERSDGAEPQPRTF